MMKRLLLGVLLSFMTLIVQLAHAAEFVITDIRIEGLQRVDAALAFQHLPLQVGDQADQRALAAATRSLFKSGYFEDIVLQRDDGVLVIQLKERPAIASITLAGNKLITTEQLQGALKGANLIEGEIFQRSTLAQIELELERQYNAMGRYAVLVQTRVQELEENRVGLEVEVNEGVSSVISHINIVGNDKYSDDQLRDMMTLKTENFWSLFTKSSQYSRERLTADLETIRSYYLDRGHVLFNIESTQVAISPDKTQVFITININEGAEFKVGEVTIAGEMPVAEEQVNDLVMALPGTTFSRLALLNIAKEVKQVFGDSGFAFAQVQPMPLVNAQENTVDLQFLLRAGKRTYVRRINFNGNTSTSDDVLRREMRQMEGGVASFADINASKLRLQRLGFFTEVNASTKAVAGTDDMLDVDFDVVEGLTADWSVMVGYTDGEGAFWGGSINQNNFLGSGNKLEAGFSSSSSTQEYNFKYLNPYYTVDGVSRGIDLTYQKRDYSKIDVSNYATDRIGVGMSFGYPVSDYSRLDFNLGYEKIDLTLPSSPTNYLSTFTNAEGTSYQQWKSTVTWNDNNLNDFWFPTQGRSHRLNLYLALPTSDLSYYQTTYNYRFFTPLDRTSSYVASFGAQLGYTDVYGDTSIIPPFANYYAGGYGSVRGFEHNSLGPTDTGLVTGTPIGGQMLTAATGEFIFPLFTDMPSVRTMLFMDVGNVFEKGGFMTSELRSSTGFSLAWLTPVGPLTLVMAQPLKSETSDRVTRTHITLGRSY
ncbi:MAG: outer membrane protein assembly factor BamA [Gammaproteobacteria bacterium]|nr:outer membrane protein assembly factor BamA [Gammaproteobacteria bacterium]